LERNLLGVFALKVGRAGGHDGNGEKIHENLHSDGHFQRDSRSFFPPGAKRAAQAGGLSAAARSAVNSPQAAA
jgi:hypothetical protein